MLILTSFSPWLASQLQGLTDDVSDTGVGNSYPERESSSSLYLPEPERETV